MVSTFVHVVQKENFTGLWRGTSPSLQRSIPGIGLYFTSLTFLKSQLGKSDKDLAPLEALSIGVTARSFTAACSTPLTIVKTRFEVRFHPPLMLFVYVGMLVVFPTVVGTFVDPSSSRMAITPYAPLSSFTFKVPLNAPHPTCLPWIRGMFSPWLPSIVVDD
jgi:hypothetical protein